jgi:hypothetical protein
MQSRHRCASVSPRVGWQLGVHERRVADVATADPNYEQTMSNVAVAKKKSHFRSSDEMSMKNVDKEAVNTKEFFFVI